ncbi:MAG: bifunctional phosphopantothenoylcysteine decarboxylase/phosphopantothenate--cysteine ligase CoaBC [Ignavibacteria bacterium]|nr:bifunctional phosphopantothenoylcysteine decarboxylase/phosphopantothenate--cysteine ligase CoaBC [Ignavibacteria bacterium]
MGLGHFENIFEGKNIILGITGSIAAYKSLLLIRELKRRNANVFPVLTPFATHFVTKLTVSNLAKNPVAVDMFDPEIQKSGAWHIDLVHRCDLMIIAPATASTIGKIANGVCDNALVTLATALPKNTPLLIAPAMDTSMWEHPTTQRNVQILREIGGHIIPPSFGELSSGLIGEGRFPEIPVLLDYIETFLYFREIGLERYNEIRDKIKDKNILVTAGPTHEKIDDIRYISNYSSGKMGFAIAIQSHILGAKVKLITGPSKIQMHHPISLESVTSAKNMFDAVVKDYQTSDATIMASAVADYCPETKFQGKLKKDTSKEIFLRLIRTPDILSELGKNKKHQILVGFALESSQDGLKNALKKLSQKNCDLIVLNYFDTPNSGFSGDNNTITILEYLSNEELIVQNYPSASKNICSLFILERISKHLR